MAVNVTATVTCEQEAESKKSVDRIVEEFRRYKVRSEIARKQKDSEQRHSSSSSPAPSCSGAGAGSTSGSVSVEQAMSEGTLGYFSSSSSSSSGDAGAGSGLSPEAVQARINKETNRWKVAYESVVKENEQLRHRGMDGGGGWQGSLTITLSHHTITSEI